ncbi:MAG: ornithine--oxo-acid transaminase [Alphaproteobacteria bacterium]
MATDRPAQDRPASPSAPFTGRSGTDPVADFPGPRGASFVLREEVVGAHNYASLPVVLSHGEGEWLYDTEGRRYLDMMSAYSAVSFGHSHPRLVDTLTEQAKRLAIVSRAFHTDKLAPFLAKLTEVTGLPRALPMNTGAEAVETAIKAARRWGYRVKGIPQDCAEIIVATDNFHGRTTTIVSFSTDEEYRDDFGPFTPGFRPATYGNLDCIDALIGSQTCAVLVEPMQGEAGIRIPPAGWLKGLRELCDRNNVLLILDEVQTGMGRTGKPFAFQHEGITPDGLILGKALGGGLLPVSAFLGSDAVMDVFNPGSHGSTFGGNPLAAAVGLEALLMLEELDLSARSARLGLRLKDALSAMNSPLIRDVRGSGLWVGVDIDPDRCCARCLCEALMARGVLSKDTHETVVRFAPPLTIAEDALDWAVEQFRIVLRDWDDQITNAGRPD